MTGMREDVRGSAAGLPVPGARSVVRTVAGFPWWVSLLVGLLPTAAGVTVDVLRSGSLGLGYLIAFPLGCVVATAAARRAELFVPMVQPPLLVAVTVPAAVLATGSVPASGGTVATILAVGGPLINGFPAMAVTTAVCLALGWARIALQDRPRPSDARATRPVRRSDTARPRADDRQADRQADRPTDRVGARSGARTDARPDSRTTDRIRPDRAEAGRRAGAEPGPVDPDKRTRRLPARERAAAAGPVARPSERADRPRDDRPRDDRPREERTRDGRPVVDLALPPDPPRPPDVPRPPDDAPARRSPLVLPPEEPPGEAPPAPALDRPERPRRTREERMRAERIREERRREARRREGPRGPSDLPPER